MMFWNGLFSLHLTLTATSVLPLPRIFLQGMLLIFPHLKVLYCCRHYPDIILDQLQWYHLHYSSEKTIRSIQSFLQLKSSCFNSNTITCATKGAIHHIKVFNIIILTNASNTITCSLGQGISV